MLGNVAEQLTRFISLASKELPFMLWLIGITWSINLFNWFTRKPLNAFCLLPRSVIGIFGIIISPFIHGNFNHLFFNTIPFFVLGMFLLAFGKDFFCVVSILIILLEGIFVWIFARRYMHIGASGVVSGYFGFIIGIAYFHPTFITILLGIVAVYYFGSIILGLFPTSEAISWECHLSGFISGLILMYLFLFVPKFKPWIMSIYSEFFA